MTQTEWMEELAPLIAKYWKLDPVAAEHHPSYVGLRERIDTLIAVGIAKHYTDGEVDGYVYS